MKNYKQFISEKKYIVDDFPYGIITGAGITSLQNIDWDDFEYIKIINTNITDLKGAPLSVYSGFYCSYNQLLTSLGCAPASVGGSFYCSDNPSLTSLIGAPTYVGNFNCLNNPQLKNLIGIPAEITGGIECDEQWKDVRVIYNDDKNNRDFDCALQYNIKNKKCDIYDKNGGLFKTMFFDYIPETLSYSAGVISIDGVEINPDEDKRLKSTKL